MISNEFLIPTSFASFALAAVGSVAFGTTVPSVQTYGSVDLSDTAENSTWASPGSQWVGWGDFDPDDLGLNAPTAHSTGLDIRAN